MEKFVFPLVRSLFVRMPIFCLMNESFRSMIDCWRTSWWINTTDDGIDFWHLKTFANGMKMFDEFRFLVFRLIKETSTVFSTCFPEIHLPTSLREHQQTHISPDEIKISFFVMKRPMTTMMAMEKEGGNNFSIRNLCADCFEQPSNKCLHACKRYSSYLSACVCVCVCLWQPQVRLSVRWPTLNYLNWIALHVQVYIAITRLSACIFEFFLYLIQAFRTKNVLWSYALNRCPQHPYSPLLSILHTHCTPLDLRLFLVTDATLATAAFVASRPYFWLCGRIWSVFPLCRTSCCASFFQSLGLLISRASPLLRFLESEVWLVMRRSFSISILLLKTRPSTCAHLFQSLIWIVCCKVKEPNFRPRFLISSNFCLAAFRCSSSPKLVSNFFHSFCFVVSRKRNVHTITRSWECEHLCVLVWNLRLIRVCCTRYWFAVVFCGLCLQHLSLLKDALARHTVERCN